MDGAMVQLYTCAPHGLITTHTIRLRWCRDSTPPLNRCSSSNSLIPLGSSEELDVL